MAKYTYTISFDEATYLQQNGVDLKGAEITNPAPGYIYTAQITDSDKGNLSRIENILNTRGPNKINK